MPIPTLEHRTLVMAILNVTPDSFSDGGLWFDPDRAVERAEEMIAEGADIVDVGGESTRPGAEPVPVDEELRRVVPVVEALAGRVRLSVDTTKEKVAVAAVQAGASLINDVSASLWEVAARLGVGWVAMHRKGSPATMQQDPHYGNVVAEVAALLCERAVTARAAGVDEVWIDPGIGFGKSVDHNLRLLGCLADLVATGYPVMVGTSRKSFLGALSRSPGGPAVPVADRLPASLATATWAMQQGARMVRVHDVSATVQAARLVGPDAPARPGPVGSGVGA
ncbi:MAG TPA: dihydropteroate synthase [Acidimicrobiales bacterium]|jgi:dihydropteroate synthase|nr:dihydropteroate synthase [Acidimicrobiales bacterium]